MKKFFIQETIVLWLTYSNFVVVILKSFSNSFVMIASLIFLGSKRAGTQIQTKCFDKLTLKFSAFIRAFIALKEALRLLNISGSIV